MKNIFFIVLAFVAFTSCQQQQKIGFVNNSEIINKYQMKIDLEAKFDKKDQAYKKKTDSIGLAYQLDAQETQERLSKLSEQKQREGSQAFTQKWQVKQQQLQFEQQQMQQEFNKEIDSILTKVKEFVGDYGKANGYAFILGKNEAGSVMYGDETKDLTQTIIEALNADYKKD